VILMIAYISTICSVLCIIINVILICYCHAQVLQIFNILKIFCPDLVKCTRSSFSQLLYQANVFPAMR
jgi:hypothetical protein